MFAQRIVISGAGHARRAFVTDLFDAAGYRILSVDRSKQLMTHLRHAGHCTVAHAHNQPCEQRPRSPGQRRPPGSPVTRRAGRRSSAP